MAGENPATTTEYIQHHLTNLVYGNHPENGWSFAHGAQEAAEMGFMAVHVDSMAWSIGLGVLVLLAVPLRGKACDHWRTHGPSQLC